ncbi:MAG: hypothetical protein IT260_17480 [Saprospiraceae bacterium]|nr:hypothetical protein [Saprospiraceae bacterium]
MVRLFSFITIVLTIAFLVTGIVHLIARAFAQILSWDPESRAFKRMLETLRHRLSAERSSLVPWDREMLSLLSLNRINERKPGWFNPLSSGQFTTIYQEPVVAYVFQSSGNIRVTLAQTNDREFIFRRKGKETEIWMNGQPFGLFIDGALLAPGKGSKLLARLDNRPEEAQSPLILGNNTALTLNNPQRASSPNPRALSLLRDLNPEEENQALALALMQLTGM